MDQSIGVQIITADPNLDGLSPKGSKLLLSNGRVVELAPIRRSWAGIHNNPSGQHVGELSVAAVDHTPGASTQGYVDDTPGDFGSLRQSFFVSLALLRWSSSSGQMPPNMLIWPGVCRSPPGCI
ncbi:hypothetical protein PIB30_060680 [Stylosanthes scabra]|uniref:Uncharacterized protein n=1 Tax=Stylosanthes scabra TaxID=79078 RepID=A0ABU6QKY1_9FABA|nr:hypothetical protein [Stylosanthes scabra]